MTDERDELWQELGVDNQTAAIVRIRGLIERDERRRFMVSDNPGKPDKKGTVLIGVVIAAVIVLVVVAVHNGLLG